MIYTNLTKKAMRIAFEAHKEQVDKSGIPYIYHPTIVAEKMKDELTTCVALLHDVVEDSNMTFARLKEEGFTKEIIDALRLLTHDEGKPYMDYIRKIKENPVAAKVKMADLEHNSDLSRLDIIDEKSEHRRRKYAEAMKLLR